jgi:hypothetical protein
MTLFEEYAASFARGERPDLRAYLARAGEEADELAQLVDAFLARAEPPPPDDEAVALAGAWLASEPPLVGLRARRGVRRAEVVEALIARFGLDPAKRAKVARYYHEVEIGQRIPADERLIAAIAEILRTRASDLLSWRPRPIAPQPAYYRTEAAAAVPLSTPLAEEPDEIDRLFAPRER